jgi:thiamine pyrophosphate-dependent acetolactate synthase large subunit-like protein
VGAERPVLGVTGDGGFGQYLAEVTTAVKHRMRICHVLLDNHELGKISKEQLAAHHAVWQTSLVNPDFAAYARLCGAHGARVDRADQLDAALAEALAVDGPSLVHVLTDGALV